MKTIFQDGESDCGPVAVAMLANVNPNDVREYIYGARGRRGLTSSGYLIRALEHFGRKALNPRRFAIPNPCKTYENGLIYLEHDALLGGALMVPQQSGKWKATAHWGVWDCNAQVIRDPHGFYFPFWVRKFVEVL